MKKILFLLFTMLFSMKGVIVFAARATSYYDIAVQNADGVTIYYKIMNDTELKVTYREKITRGFAVDYYSGYEGDFVIPETVYYDGTTYTVTSIGEYAFTENILSSITIPKSIKYIDERIFNGHNSGLTSVYISDIASWCEISFGAVSSYFNILQSGARLYLNGVLVEDLIIPDGVTIINHCSFLGCNQIKSVRIPKSVTDIGNYAFYNDNLLTVYSEIELPFDCPAFAFNKNTQRNGTLYIPAGTKDYYIRFDGWRQFLNIVEMEEDENTLVSQITLNTTNKELIQGQTFQLSATVVPNNATNKNTKWSSSKMSVATVSNSGLITAIAAGSTVITCAAQDGSGVKATCNVTVKASSTSENIQFTDAQVKRICVKNWDANGDGELSEDEAANVRSLGYAFGLSSITTFDELRFFTGLTTIDEHAFDRCPNLQSVTIPSQVTSIGRAAFSACGALTTVDLPEGLTTIEEMSFERCSGLKSITIPSKVTNIGRAAFSVCSSLTTMILPEGLTSIPELCFERCSGLKSINIPASVNSIGNNAFAQCNSLEDIVSDILEPFDIDASVFTNTTYSSARLCVPKGTKSKYRNVLGWKNFKNILEDGLGEAEINVVSIDIVGDGIVGTPHNYAIKLENVGSVDFTGTLYVWIYEDSEPIESYFNSYNGGIPASVAGTLSSEEDFYFNPSGIYYIWLTTDAEGKNILGSKKAFTVTPAATLTVGNYTRVYGDDNPEFKFTADKGGYNGTPEIICHAKVDSPAGTYPIVITQGGVDNDFVNYVNGTLTITKAPLTIMAGTYIKKQGEDNPDFTLTYKGFKNGETEAVLTKKPTVTTSADWNSPVGVYDVIVTGAEAKNYEISYVAGTLTVEKRPKGDLNAKGYTDVTDVVAAINHALGERTLTYDEKEMLDMNDDGELNVGDIILLVKAILEQGNVVNVPVMARGETEDIDLTKYTAMQLTMNVPAGARIRDIQLAGDNNSSHQLMYQQKDAEHYTVVVYSMSNQTFKPVSGCLLEVDMEGEGEPTTANVLLATPAGERTFISSLPIGTVTGISIVGADQIAIGSVYDLRGNKVLDRGASMKRLPKGVYIMNGKKIIR